MEQVFTVRREDFFGGDWPQGFTAWSAGAAADLLQGFWQRGRFVPRPLAEEDPSRKQLIPYCVLRAAEAILCVRRTKAQGEARLHGSWSIGLGGHVNPDDADPDDLEGAGPERFRKALQRELEEELHDAVGPGLMPVFVGLCNDDSTAVGRVHAGLVYILDCPVAATAPLPRVREISKMQGCFHSLAEMAVLWQDAGRFESWSRILIEAGVAGAMAVTATPGVLAPQGTDGLRESKDG